MRLTNRFASSIAASLLLAPSLSLAERDADNLEDLLPRRETQREWDAWRGRERELAALWAAQHRADPPPDAPIRNCAEWEPLTGIMIRYPLGLPYTLLRDMDDDVILHVVVASSWLASAQSNLSANGVDMDRVQFLVEPNETIWTRDYGPWFVFDGNDDVVIVDHVYNRPARPNDDLIPIKFGAQQGIPVSHHDMWHTGGNYMTDGAHISSSTDLVYDEALAENGMSPAEVDQLMFDYYGIEDYHVMDDIEAGGIHHIDTWAKFLNEETVLVKQVWSAHHTYAPLNQRATLLASLQASTGRNYQVFRVNCHNLGDGTPASYTNSLLGNNLIYVPTFNSATNDNAALDVYRAAAPGYDVRGYNYNGWLTDDALHCRAMGIADRGMLRLAHIPVVDEQVGPVLIAADVHAHSGSAVTLAELHYRQDGGSWDVIAMTPVGGDAYEAVIPSPPGAGTTEYYLHTEDASGRAEGMPRVEPAAWYSFPHVPSASGVEDLAPSSLLQLAPARPNPFRGSTTFSFALASADRVELAVFDTQGRRVRTLLRGEQSAGSYEIAWDGRDDSGRRLPAGVYRYRLRAAGLVYGRPVVLTE